MASRITLERSTSKAAQRPATFLRDRLQRQEQWAVGQSGLVAMSPPSGLPAARRRQNLSRAAVYAAPRRAPPVASRHLTRHLGQHTISPLSLALAGLRPCHQSEGIFSRIINGLMLKVTINSELHEDEQTCHLNLGGLETLPEVRLARDMPKQLNGESRHCCATSGSGQKAVARVRRTQPAAYLKILALLVPREHKVEHSNALKNLTDEQLEAMIEYIKSSLEAQAGGRAIEGTIETVEPTALPALEPPRPKNRLMLEADTAVGPSDHKRSRKVPSPSGA